MAMTDVMLDIETTGCGDQLPIDNIGVIQIAAIKFSHDTGEIGETFNRCLSMAPNRGWEEGTREWWHKRRAILQSIIARMEDPSVVMEDFIAFSLRDAPYGGYRFWSKPTSFDFPLIASYCRQFGYRMPYHFRIARDLNTYTAAKKGGADHVDLDHITIDAPEHDALNDCVLQLKRLFAARDKLFGEVLPA